MKTLQYTGWRSDLKGRTALVRLHHIPTRGRVLVQFNPPNGVPIEQCKDPLCFGWHDFAADQFKPNPEAASSGV